MRNFLKFSSLKLREPKAFCQIQGPSLVFAKKTKLTLADNIVEFKVPGHAPRNNYISAHGPWYKNNSLECRPVDAEFVPSQNWSKLLVFSREWAFYGSWFMGAVTHLHLAGTVITRNQEKADQDISPDSLFHPRAFEYEVCQYLNDYYGHNTDQNKADWLAPVNWRPIKGLSVFGGRFDIAPYHMPNTRTHRVAVPITSTHILLLDFTLGGIVEASNIQNGQCEFAHVGQARFRIDNTPVLELMESIIQSITITLSDKSQQAYDKVKAENPDLKMAVSETLAPLQWPVK